MNWSTREHGSRQLRSAVQCFERSKLFLGKCILEICQDNNMKSTSLVLPRTQRHAKFEVALRGCSRDANDDYSRIHTATRSNCSFPVHFHPSSRTSRQTRQLLAKVVSSQTLLTSRYSCCILDRGFRFRHISSIFLSIARRTQRGTDFVGWESSTIQLKNPSGMLKDSVTCSPDSTFCLGTSPRGVIWLSGRCPVS